VASGQTGPMPFHLAGRNRTARLLGLATLAAVTTMASAGVAWLVAAPTPTTALRPVAARPATCAGHRVEAPRELRGMWLTTVLNLDWPSRAGLDADTVRAEYRGWLDLAQRLNHNAIFVHVRPSGDALWPSAYAPWSEWLTGRRDGQDPGWDPLSYIVDEAHARNLELHAWFNPYRGSQPAPSGPGADLARLAPDHPLRRHPEWAVTFPDTDARRLYFNPGIPQVRRFVEDAILEAVTRYDIDGVHFDDFFYPYPVAGHEFDDAAAFATYGGGFPDRGDWRRDNVNTFIREMSSRIKAVKPTVKFGISPFGIWRNVASDPAGSPTRGLQSYDAIYADTRKWIREEWLDYVVPQLYWHIGFDVADYARLVPWWVDVVAGTRVQLYIGQADYRVGQPGVWQDPGELDRQLALNRRYPVAGSVHFSARHLREDRLGAVTRYRDAHYPGPALVPRMRWKPAAPPAAPTALTARRDPADTTILTWRPGPGAETTGFAVYRVDDPSAGGGAATLVAAVRRTGAGEQVWVDRTPARAGSPTYCVTGMDRLWNEGPPSAPAQPT